MQMLSRGFALTAIAGSAMTIFFSAAAFAQSLPFEVDERFTGGAPRGKLYSMFGMSPVPRTTVSFPSKEKPGTIIINTAERRLYYVLGDGRAVRYGIGVGRDGFRWGGVKTVSAKREWPDWTPPAQMLQRRPDLPRHMPGGPENPLGARAMYLGSTLYRIHGSNEPETIGQAVSSGCFRMTNDDVIDLYNRVKVGTKVVVMN
jgi:lipoprotein-anchoring transpeptidase ErfK/SrfK